ncbi:hypothetical protein D3C78_1291150 [compost metagenome]
MVTRSYRHAIVIQETAHIVGMMLAQIKGNNAFTRVRAVQREIRDAGQLRQRIAHQRRFILGDSIQTECGNVVDCRTQPDDPARVRRSRFKAPRGFGIGRALRQANGRNHRSAPFPRRHRLQNIVFHIQHTDSGWAIQLVTGKHVKITVQRLHINGVMHNGLRAIHQHFCTSLMRFRNDFCDRIRGAKNIRDLRNRHQSCTLIEQRVELFQLQRAIHIEWDDAQMCA